MSKEGLVAPVWSDSSAYLDYTKIECQRSHTYSFEGIKWPTFDFNPPKVSTAKDALPQWTRESGNRRGPGWCDE